MLTSADVLQYVRAAFPGLGRTQRMKLLYYAQAWHATWFGGPLFSDPVIAFERGPVAELAWRADQDADAGRPMHGATGAVLNVKQKATIDAVWAFYGHMSGTALSELTHVETPWIRHYEEVPPSFRGRKPIPVSDMVRHYSAATMDGQPTPVKPVVASEPIDPDEFEKAFIAEIDRWSETLALLADR